MMFVGDEGFVTLNDFSNLFTVPIFFVVSETQIVFEKCNKYLSKAVKVSIDFDVPFYIVHCPK